MGGPQSSDFWRALDDLERRLGDAESAAQTRRKRGTRSTPAKAHTALFDPDPTVLALRDELNALLAATGTVTEAAQSVAEEHGRALVHVQRAIDRRPGPDPRLAAAPADVTPAPGGHPADLVRKTGLSFLTQVTTAALTAVLTLFLVRRLVPADYGVFSLALGISGLLLLPADFGISGSLARFAAEAQGDRRRVAALIGVALRLKLVIAVAISAGLFLLAPALARVFDTPDLLWPLRAATIALAGQSLFTMFSSVFIAVGRISSNLRLVALESTVEVGASIALVVTGAGATGALLGRGAGYAVGAVFGGILAARVFGPAAVVPRGSAHVDGSRSLVRYAGALLIVDGAFALFSQVDVLLIGQLLGTASVGLFAAPLRLCALLHYPGLAVANSVAPRIARTGRTPPDTPAFLTALRGLIVVQAAIVTGILVWAEPITRTLLGAQYAESATVLRALTPFILLQGIGPLVSVSVNYLGGARRRVPIAVGAVLVNLVIDLILIPKIGIVGGAIGTDVAYAIYVPAHLLLCRRELGLDLRPVLRTVARSTVAAALMAIPLLLAGTHDLALSHWIAGSAGAALVFLAALVATGELPLAAVRAAPQRLRSR